MTATTTVSAGLPPRSNAGPASPEAALVARPSGASLPSTARDVVALPKTLSPTPAIAPLLMKFRRLIGLVMVFS
jgi:hypothetical protein